MRRLAALAVILGFVTPVRASAAGDLDQARYAVQAGDVRGGGQGPGRAGARQPHPRHRERPRADRAGGRPARRAGDAARHADADRDLRHGRARPLPDRQLFQRHQARRRRSSSTSPRSRSRRRSSIRTTFWRSRPTTSCTPARCSRRAARSRRPPTKPIRTRRIRSSSPSRRARASSIPTRATRSRPGATSTGKGSWRSSSASRRSRSPKRRRTITCSATASCTTSATAAAPAAGR